MDRIKRRKRSMRAANVLEEVATCVLCDQTHFYQLPVLIEQVQFSTLGEHVRVSQIVLPPIAFALPGCPTCMRPSAPRRFVTQTDTTCAPVPCRNALVLLRTIQRMHRPTRIRPSWTRSGLLMTYRHAGWVGLHLDDAIEVSSRRTKRWVQM